MPPTQKLLRLRRVIFSQTVNVGGIAATTWIDGHMGWQLNLRPDSGVIVLNNNGQTFAVGPSCWVSCEVGEPEAPRATLTVAEAPMAVLEVSSTLPPKADRIPVADIRARQAAAQKARSNDT